MNAIPITLTIYYPTMAQVERFLFASSLASIAIALFLLVFTFGDPAFTKNGRAKSLPFAFLLVNINPYGGMCSILVSCLTKSEIALALAYFVSPVAFLYIWSF